MNGQRRLAGRYRLLNPLGAGSLWLAADDLMRRDVGIREVRLPPDPSARRELCGMVGREVGLVTGLGHASIEAVHEVIVEDGTPWLVVDLPQGRTLEQTVLERHPLPPVQVARIGVHLVAALRAVHGVGVVHGDIQPSTIVLTPTGRAVLTGFGVATPFRPQGVGPAADLWSLAATLHFGLEGRPPQPGQPIGGALGPLLTDMLNPDPAARPTAETVAAAFADLAGTAPPSPALPPPTPPLPAPPPSAASPSAPPLSAPPPSTASPSTASPSAPPPSNASPSAPLPSAPLPSALPLSAPEPAPLSPSPDPDPATPASDLSTDDAPPPFTPAHPVATPASGPWSLRPVDEDAEQTTRVEIVQPSRPLENTQRDPLEVTRPAMRHEALQFDALEATRPAHQTETAAPGAAPSGPQAMPHAFPADPTSGQATPQGSGPIESAPEGPGFGPMGPEGASQGPGFSPAVPEGAPEGPGFGPAGPDGASRGPGFGPVGPEQASQAGGSGPMGAEGAPQDPGYGPLGPEQASQGGGLGPAAPQGEPEGAVFDAIGPDGVLGGPAAHPADPVAAPLPAWAPAPGSPPPGPGGMPPGPGQPFPPAGAGPAAAPSEKPSLLRRVLRRGPKDNKTAPPQPAGWGPVPSAPPVVGGPPPADAPWGASQGPVDPAAIGSHPAQAAQPGQAGPEQPSPHPGGVPGSWGPAPGPEGWGPQPNAAPGPWGPPGHTPAGSGPSDGNGTGPWGPPGHTPAGSGLTEGNGAGPWGPPAHAPAGWGPLEGNGPGPSGPPGHAPAGWGPTNGNGPGPWGPHGGNEPGPWGPPGENGPGPWGPPGHAPAGWGPPGGNGPGQWAPPGENGPPPGGNPAEGQPPRASLGWGVTDDAAPPVLAAMPGEPEPEPVPIVETTAPFRRPTFTGPLVLTDEPQGKPSRPEAVPEQPPRPLEHILHAAGPLAPEEAAAVGLGVLDLLAPLHDAGHYHGDLRPETILVGGGGQVTLADPAPAQGMSPYTAPEGNVGPAADLWSLGATLFTAVEGRAPAPGAPLTRAGVLAPVLFRLLSGAPRQRLTADELRLDLQAIAAVPTSPQP
ncbi:hypothetical protein ACFXJ8_31405 [Nonomuraea sp. NPDC059194]|uniref:protein kinase domain-containing protein n=1 Tax=Nonomuraea sp. NPDC059194 TaxID=3346764 RepID=UPI00369B1C5F